GNTAAEKRRTRHSKGGKTAGAGASILAREESVNTKLSTRWEYPIDRANLARPDPSLRSRSLCSATAQRNPNGARRLRDMQRCVFAYPPYGRHRCRTDGSEPLRSGNCQRLP